VQGLQIGEEGLRVVEMAILSAGELVFGLALGTLMPHRPEPHLIHGNGESRGEFDDAILLYGIRS